MVTIDGGKIRANTSKHKAMSYRWMREEAARLEAEIAETLYTGDGRPSGTFRAECG